MKIGVIVRLLWSAGTQKFAISQAKALQDIGHEVTIIFLRKTAHGRALMQLLDGIDYRIMADHNPSILTFFYDFLTGVFMKNRKGEGRVDYNLLRNLPEFIRNLDFDYLICHDQFAGLGGYYSKKKLGVNYSVVIHERLSNYPWIRGYKRILAYLALRWQRKILFEADATFTLTAAVAQTVKDFYSGKVEVFDVFPGLTNKIERNYNRKKDQIVLLSYWREDKNPYSYIPMFKELDGYKFIIAGNWLNQQYKKEYVRRLQTEGVIEKVIFEDNLSEHEKDILLKESKFYVRFGSEEKGPGYGTIEALELGLPIICSSSLGISHYLENKDFALLVDTPDDVDKIRKYIKICDNKQIYDSLQLEIEGMVNEYSWQTHALALTGIIKGRLNQKGSVNIPIRKKTEKMGK